MQPFDGEIPSASGVPTMTMIHDTWIITRLVHFTSGLRVSNRSGKASGSPASFSAML